MEEIRREGKEVDAKPWLKTGAVTEKRVVFPFDHLDIPPYDEWFQPCGISQTEFTELMTTVIEAMKEVQDNKCCFITILILTAGIGFCPVLIAEENRKSKIIAALDAFNGKH